jgi:hypothetical protein
MARPRGLPKTGGRKKGVPNRTTVLAREAFNIAFHGIGGVDELVTWGKANRDEFYKLYARLIPVDVTSGGDKIAALTWSFGDRTVKF